MTNPRYSYRIFWSDESDCYIAQLPEFPTISGKGATPADALREAASALGVTIELYQDEGWELPDPRPEAAV